jgi:hypothetical protein
MGTGELMSLRKPIGREKLDLLGEDLVAQSMKNALAPPFNIERLLNTADAEYGAHLDNVKWLKDPDLCYQEILKEVYASVPQSMGRTVLDPLTDRNVVTNVIGTRVHNSYMLASAWRIVRDRLELLEHEGIVNYQVRLQLAKNPGLRAEYLAVCDVLGALVDALQARFSLLATTPGVHRPSPPEMTRSSHLPQSTSGFISRNMKITIQRTPSTCLTGPPFVPPTSPTSTQSSLSSAYPTLSTPSISWHAS